MIENRVSIVGDGEFNPREWLRREVLWASLMAPYGQQLEDWVKESGNRVDQHLGNLSRQEIYSRDLDPESQALSFFNQGKNIGGLITSAIVFDSLMEISSRTHVDILAIQSRNVDRVLKVAMANPMQSPVDSTDVFDQATRNVRMAVTNENGQYGNTHRLIRARRLMNQLASFYTGDWIMKALHEEGDGLTHLVINDGGTPRSAGPRVDRLQPVFREILNSEHYLSL